MPDGTTVFFSNRNLNNVMAMETATNTVSATLPVKTGPVHLFMDPANAKLWVSNDGSASLTVIDVSTSIGDRQTGEVRGTIVVGDAPNALAVARPTGRLPCPR